MDALDIHQLTKTYQGKFKALKGIDLIVPQGQFFGLLGPNGAGKTTTIGILCSLVRKTSGTVKVFGVDIDRDISLAKSYIGLVPQEFNFNIFESCMHILVKQAGYYGIPRKVALVRAENYLKKLELWDKAYRPARELSGGMKRRLMIARALMNEPRLLILDEPTAGVDIELRRYTWHFLQEINQQGITVILTTHYLEEAEHLCEKIAIIDQGLIVKQGATKALVRELNMETFIMDLQKPLNALPALGDFSVRLTNDSTLEVDIPKEKELNNFFTLLTNNNITVTSMRNKSNRLEELFINLVERKK